MAEREKLPNRKLREASRLGRKWQSGRKSPTGSYEKQAGWVENGGTGENPQPEGTEKQAGWGESGRARETPQPEATRSSAR